MTVRAYTREEFFGKGAKVPAIALPPKGAVFPCIYLPWGELVREDVCAHSHVHMDGRSLI